MTRRIFYIVMAVLLAGSFAWSNPQDDSYTRIARLSYLEGRVSYQHSSDVDWSAASINLPLEPGDRIYSGPDGRAEVEFDDGSVFRLAENTDVEILSLKQELIQLRILVGLSTLTVSGDADFEVDTPAAAFNPVTEGVYRFDVVENGDTDAIVRKGELEAANNNFSRRLTPGDLLHISPRDAGNPEVSLYDRRDAWDEWNDRRNADLRAYGNVRYLPDNVYMGASELDRYGRWVNVESYGTAWVPYGVDPYWSPYSVGRWCYRPFYGWTWVSYEPWGWLPYHYGSWYHSSIYGWSWIPGPAFGFNFWSPGLVTFYSGPGWVSWCPLGPGDYYDARNYHYNHGIYSHQLAELRRFHTRSPESPFNRDVRGAFRTAQMDQFRNGSFDNRNRNANTRWGNIDRPWAQGTLVRDRLTVQPTSMSFSAAPDRPAIVPRATSTLPSVVRNIPGQNSANRRAFTSITNPQIPAVSPRNVRGRSEAGIETRGASQSNTRVIQVPQTPSVSAPASQGERRTNSSRSSSSQGTRGSTTVTRPGRATPSNPQSSPGLRNQRSAPERNTAPQRAPAAAPRSELRQENNYSAARPGIGRWSDSGATPVPRGTIQTYSAPRSNNSGGSGNYNPPAVSSPEPDRAPAYRESPSGGDRGWGGSNSRSYSAPRPSAPSYSAPRQSAPSGGRPTAAPSQSSGGARDNSSGHGRQK